MDLSWQLARVLKVLEQAGFVPGREPGLFVRSCAGQILVGWRPGRHLQSSAAKRLDPTSPSEQHTAYTGIQQIMTSALLEVLRQGGCCVTVVDGDLAVTYPDVRRPAESAPPEPGAF